MIVEILEVNENDDGSATITLDLDDTGKQFLLEAGFNAIMKQALADARTQKLVDAIEAEEPKKCDCNGGRCGREVW